MLSMRSHRRSRRPAAERAGAPGRTAGIAPSPQEAARGGPWRKQGGRRRRLAFQLESRGARDEAANAGARPGRRPRRPSSNGLFHLDRARVGLCATGQRSLSGAARMRGDSFAHGSSRPVRRAPARGIAGRPEAPPPAVGAARRLVHAEHPAPCRSPAPQPRAGLGAISAFRVALPAAPICMPMSPVLGAAGMPPDRGRWPLFEIHWPRGRPKARRAAGCGRRAGAATCAPRPAACAGRPAAAAGRRRLRRRKARGQAARRPVPTRWAASPGPRRPHCRRRPVRARTGRLCR